MNNKEIISSGLLELYVLGLANDQEIAEVNSLAKKYPEIAAEIQSIEAAMESYALLNAIEPGQSVKEKICSTIDQASQQDSSSAKVVSISSYWKYAAAASIILFIASSIFNIIIFNKYQAATRDYLAAVYEKNNLQDQLAEQERSNTEMKNDMGVIQSKYSEPVSLHGLEKSPDAAAKIFWMKNTGEVYIDPSNLPDAPTGMQYQLWGIVNGKPVDGGMIILSKKGDKYRIHKMKSFGKAEAFAVTLETAGGNPTPKGDMYVMGKM